MSHRVFLALLLIVGTSLNQGCTTIPSWMAYGPFATTDNSNYRTPTMRIDTIREFASQSTGLDSEDQRTITDQLARQIQIEPDPLVREAIIETLGEFQTPLAQQVLQAGIQDSDPDVQIACCEQLGRRGDSSSIPILLAALNSRQNTDVRLAAAEALGEIRSPEAIQALSTALEDSNPALQFVGIQSLRNLSDQDFGGDVAAWKQYVAGGSPQIGNQPPTSVAERLRQASPF